MNRTLLLLFPFIVLSCSKTTSVNNTANKAIVQLCSSNPVPYNGVIDGQGIWNIYNYPGDSLLSTTLWDSSSYFVLLNTGSYRFKNFGVSTTITNDTTIKYYDTLLSFTTGKVYSIFTVLGRTIVTSQTITTPNAANIIEETDTVSPAKGYAKIRLIVAVPQLGISANNTASNLMHPALTFYDNNGDTIAYTNNRYYLDHLDNPALTHFTTIPAGIYNQLGNIAFPNSYAFTVESGRKYTILVTQMIRNQYPNLDHFYLISHIF